MDTAKITQTVGLHLPTRRKTPKDIEDRMYLQYAIDKADLNVSERLAINEAFYPNGGGFDLFQKDKSEAEVILYKNGKDDEQDEFTKELIQIEVPKNVSFNIKTQTSQKGNFETNLTNALNKLKKMISSDK